MRESGKWHFLRRAQSACMYQFSRLFTEAEALIFDLSQKPAPIWIVTEETYNIIKWLEQVSEPPSVIFSSNLTEEVN